MSKAKLKIVQFDFDRHRCDGVLLTDKILLSDGRIFEVMSNDDKGSWAELTPLEDLKAYLASEGKEL